MVHETRTDERDERPEEPWIVTRSGGLFFVNALLVFPHVMVTIPLLTRVLVRSAGGLRGESRIVDTFPTIAEYLLPRMGWLLVVPIGLAILNLRWERDRRDVRLALHAILLAHLAYLAWTVGTWAGMTGGTLPGGWP